MSGLIRVNSGIVRVNSGALGVAAPASPPLALTGFNYTTDNYSLTNPSVVQTDQAIVSLWFKWDTAFPAGGQTFNFMIHNSGGRFYFDFSPAGQIQIVVYNAAVTQIQLVTSSVTPSWRTDNAWHHLLYSRSGTTSHLYIDDVEDKFIHGPNTAGNASNNTGNWFVGMAFNNTFGFKGCLSNMYQNHQEYLDFSIVANRRKFITAALEPVNPGSDGSSPTGTSPEIWIPNGLPTTNAGAEANYSLVSGDGAIAC